MKNYDNVILQHYKQVALETGKSELSTMSHEFIRNSETNAIKSFIEYFIGNNKESSPVIADIGCGNGYTLEVLHKAFPSCNFVGFEYTPELKEIASDRFTNTPNVKIVQADIRDKKTLGTEQIDALLCQRVLINLLDLEDQKQALLNLIELVKVNGCLFFIETFQSGLDLLNEARKEFELEPIPPAHHNLNLPDNFFDMPGILKEIKIDSIAENFLSNYYYISRVLHPVMLGNIEFKRNSHFVNFFLDTLPDNSLNNYSALKIRVFQKK